MKRKLYLLIEKLHELTNNYIELDDDLSNAGECSRLINEIEEISREICMLGTDLTDDELIEFLDSRQIKEMII